MTMHHQVVSWMQFFTALPPGSISRQQTKISNIRCHHRSPPSANDFAALPYTATVDPSKDARFL